MRRTAGQSTVEVIGLLPLLLAVGVGVFALLSAGAAREAASGAAEAGAVALLQGRDARAAARSALAGWPRDRTSVGVTGRRVTVRVTPSGPLGARLRAVESADAGAPPPHDASSSTGRPPAAAAARPSSAAAARPSSTAASRPSSAAAARPSSGHAR